jgi:hypothetical protein
MNQAVSGSVQMDRAEGTVSTVAAPADMYAETKQTSLRAPAPDSGYAPGEDRTIIKTANLSLVVDDVRQTVDQVNSLVKTHNGLVVSSNIAESQYQDGGAKAYLSLRVPVTQLEDTLTQLRKLAIKVTQDSMNADDRTKQKVDLEARIKNLKASEEQLMTIMRQAKNVQETLEVQQQLTNVRGQIEVMNAQLENVTNDAAMSSISLTISTKSSDLPVVGPQQNSIGEEIKLAVKDMIRLYRGLFLSGIRTVILLLPLLILALIGWLIWKRSARKS